MPGRQPSSQAALTPPEAPVLPSRRDTEIGNRRRRAAGASRIPASRTSALYQTIRDLSQPGIIPETLSMCLGGPASVRAFAAVLGSLEILAALLIAIRQ